MYNPQKPYKKKISELIKQTWRSPYLSVKEGTYPILKKKFSHPEIDHTDGIGTKGVYHWQQKTFRNAVLDALAVNLNDLALVRARPYKLQNHIMVPLEDERVVKIVAALVKECKKRNIAITGGENSFHNNLEGLDITTTVTGFIKVYKVNKFRIGDVLIGIQSSGLHSNGFTKVREVFGKEFRPEFVKPTLIYLEAMLALDEIFNIHGMMHITGGAHTKLKDLLKNADAVIRRNHKLEPQLIFKELYRRGVSDEEMYRTFNCGVGFILSASLKDAEKIIIELKKYKLKADIIGEIVKGNGKVKIESMFSKKVIEF